jgi:hypothetical protein
MRLRRLAGIAAMLVFAAAACSDSSDDTGTATPPPTVTLTVASFGCYESTSVTADVTVESSATRPWVDFCRGLWETGVYEGPTPDDFEVCLAPAGQSPGDGAPGQMTALVFPSLGACSQFGLTAIAGG